MMRASTRRPALLAAIWQAPPSRASACLRHTRRLLSTAAATPPCPSPPRPPRYPLRLSSQFVPTLRADSVASQTDLASLSLLVRGGYIRQSSSGIYTLLPTALRIVAKIEAIIHGEMQSIGASHLAMPTLLSSTLWKKTGRLDLIGSELYKLEDRKGTHFLLAPTHEEEVTRLVANEVESEAALPIRVYQITRKHRDEPRPRMGLLRTREFLMKDLYTFDASLPAAASTYDAVRGAYTRIFDRIFGSSPSRGWKSAEADTGAIGGSRSHEYHIQDPAGEDTLISCRECGYVANEEKAASLPSSQHMPTLAEETRVLLYGTHRVEAHSQRLVAVLLPRSRGLNDVKLQKHIAAVEKHQREAAGAAEKLELLYDSSQGSTAPTATWDYKERPEGPLARYDSLQVLCDFECVGMELDQVEEALVSSLHTFASPSSCAPVSNTSSEGGLSSLFPHQFPTSHHTVPPTTMIDIRLAVEGDNCPTCRRTGSLSTSKAIEVGHTFLLGTKYSQALDVGFTPKSSCTPSSSPSDEYLKGGRQKPFQMGCYGIGVSRIVGALAQRAKQTFDSRSSRHDAAKRIGSGFIWPRSVTPFTGVIITSDARGGKEETALRVYDGIISKSKLWEMGIEGVIRKMMDSEYVPSVESTEEMDQGGVEVDVRKDLVWDDRSSSLGSKLADADLIGYRVRVIVGQTWSKTGSVEVQLYDDQQGWSTTLVEEKRFVP